MDSAIPAATVPAPARLVADFVNTLEPDGAVDAIETPGSLRRWMIERGLLAPGAPLPGRHDLDRATGMRERLRDLLEANAGHPVSKACIESLNRFASAGRLVVRVGADGRATLRAGSTDVAGALAQIMASVYTSMTDGTWERLKPCRSGTCRWVFYDKSKNKSGAWCSMRVCGNREKARQFRRRSTR